MASMATASAIVAIICLHISDLRLASILHPAASEPQRRGRQWIFPMEVCGMLRRLMLLIAGVGLTVLGLIGLVLPVMPGLLLLIAAAGCFSLVSPRFRAGVERRLDGHPRYRGALRRWRTSRDLPMWARLRLAFWLTLRSVMPGTR
jgi:uncharacterized membrane protein YbaN (DUF454 family)